MNSGRLADFDLSCDEAVLARVDSMDERELDRFSSYIPKDLKHYVTLQKNWIEVGIFHLGIQLGCRPTRSQVAHYILSSSHSKRYRAYYALKYASVSD